MQLLFENKSALEVTKQMFTDSLVQLFTTKLVSINVISNSQYSTSGSTRETLFTLDFKSQQIECTFSTTRKMQSCASLYINSKRIETAAATVKYENDDEIMDAWI